MAAPHVQDWRDMPELELSPILEAALDAFYEHGYHGASVRDVSNRVGLTIPSLYYHHQSKQGLLFAVLERSIGSIIDRVELAAEDGVTPTVRLSHVVEAIVLSMTILPRASALDASEARYLEGDYRSRYTESQKRIEQILAGIVDDGNTACEFSVDDVPETVRAILGMTQTIPRWYDRQGRFTPSETAERYANLVLRLVGAQPN